ncbi:hypothetical protein CPB86DRAFT_780152 [Serendipita vermifera]|nr:hypothetical protein CPB86DRAFT_780152 [Serendipita vermifera]
MSATQPALNRACAECRRLKLKCDRNSPCGSCVRRGCPSICPDGQLVAGKGSRYILSSTRELHDKIEALQARIKELEAALGQLQSKVASDTHPLLARSLKTTTDSLKAEEEIFQDSGSDDEGLVDTFGSLTIDTKGETVWYGSHAGSEFLIPRKETSSTTDADLDLPIDIIILSKLFPLNKNVHDAEDIVRNLVRSYLPSRNVAYESTFSVSSKLSWITSTLRWEEFCLTIFEPIYAPGNVPNDQQVAIFFLSMALYVLGDPKRPMYHSDAHRYYHLSRVSMSLGEDILQSHSLYTIQYLQLFCTFNIIINDASGPNRAWGALGLAIRLAEMAGLHRDNEQWDKYPEQAERRRRIWWDLVLNETVYGFTMGRPRAMNPVHYNTKMPKDDEDEGKTPSLTRVLYRWVGGCLGGVLDEAFAVKPPSYASILKLDKNLRNWNFSGIPSFNQLPKVEDSEIDPKILLYSLSTTSVREIALMYLHRRYFVEALAKRPYEPLSSKYAMSVLAVHRSAILLLQGILRSSHVVEQLFTRMSFMWVHALSAYVCLSAIVIKSPGCSLAPSSLTEVDRIKNALTGVQIYRVLHAQPTINKLHEQAHIAMDRYREGKWPPNTSIEEADADVMKFIGRTDFVTIKPERATATVTTGSHKEESIGIDAHPVLFEYMKQFGNHDEEASASSSHLLPEQGIFSHDIPKPAYNIGLFDPQHSERFFEQVGNTNNPHTHSEPPSVPGQTFYTTGWPSNSLDDNSSFTLDSLHGGPPNDPSQALLFHDQLLDPGADLGRTNEQQSQDQVWEQFLSSLMS